MLWTWIFNLVWFCKLTPHIMLCVSGVREHNEELHRLKNQMLSALYIQPKSREIYSELRACLG